MWHHWLLTDDRGFVEAMWPMVEQAIDFVLDLQTPRGEILWARHADGTPWSFALLTGSSSICHSLRCAIAIAELLGHERPDWELSAARLAHVIRAREPPTPSPPSTAGPWTGTTRCSAGVRRAATTAARASTTAATPSSSRAGASAACRDRPWITAAETCECLLAYLAVGEHRASPLELFALGPAAARRRRPLLDRHRLPREVHFPGDERSTYTAAAVDPGRRRPARAPPPASRLFVDHAFLPEAALDETHEDQPSLD